MGNPYWLTDTQMERLKQFSPKSRCKPRVDDLRVLSGIIFINRNGLRWRDAPKEHRAARTLYNRWKRWSDNCVFARILTYPLKSKYKPEISLPAFAPRHLKNAWTLRQATD